MDRKDREGIERRMGKSSDKRRQVQAFIAIVSSVLFFAGCTSSKRASIPEIVPLALLDGECSLYVSIPVSEHRDFVSDMISKTTGLSSSDAKTVAGRITALYAGIGLESDSGHLEIAAPGSYPKIMLSIAFGGNSGWEKKSYTAVSSQEAIAAGFPNKSDYYLNKSVPYKLAFPTDKLLLVSPAVSPMIERYARRPDGSDMECASWINGQSGNDILFYSGKPGFLITGITGGMGENWFSKIYGRISKVKDSKNGESYLLDCTMEVQSENAKVADSIHKLLTRFVSLPIARQDDKPGVFEMHDIPMDKEKIMELLGTGD